MRKKQGVRTASPLDIDPPTVSGTSALGLQESRRTLRHAVQPNFKMQMRTRRAPAGTDRCDALTAYDRRARLDVQLRCMPVTRDKAIAVADPDHLTISRVNASEDDPAARGRLPIARWHPSTVIVRARALAPLSRMMFNSRVLRIPHRR